MSPELKKPENAQIAQCQRYRNTGNIIVRLQLVVGRRHVLTTFGRLTNAVNAKVARKVTERTWNDSTMMTPSRNYTCILHISSHIGQ